MTNPVPKATMTIRTHFDYRDILSKIQAKGRQMFGPKFKLHKEDLPVIIPLIAWMLRDEDVATQFDINLQKGIFLGGPVGAGKTRTMQLINYLTTPDRGYRIYNCAHIGIEFADKGPSIIKKYTYESFEKDQGTPLHYCFDDLGKEIDTKHYGTSCNIMEQIIMGRYEQFISHGMITHITSNLSADEIEARYGLSVRSRMREMFNRIVYPPTTNDKRK